MKEKKYFEQVKEAGKNTNILLGIIGVLVLVNLLIVKGLIGVAQNKTVVIQVPGMMEKGKYMIGSSFASDNVYRMWVRIWVDSIGTFSYENVKKKYEEIYPFLDTQTSISSKANILKFISFVETNFISQKFRLSDITIKDLPGGYKKIIAYGTVYRKIGGSEDLLSGMKYAYEFITYVKNGSIFIKSINTSFYAINSPDQKKIIKKNHYIDLTGKLK